MELLRLRKGCLEVRMRRFGGQGMKGGHTRSMACCARVGGPVGRATEMPRLANLRYYDLRPQRITEMLEAGVPEGVIREVAGHVDPAMTRHYLHPRLAARRAAVEVLATVKVSPQPAFPQGVTSQTTSQNCFPTKLSQAN